MKFFFENNLEFTRFLSGKEVQKNKKDDSSINEKKKKNS